jgi:hypothetical protein
MGTALSKVEADEFEERDTRVKRNANTFIEIGTDLLAIRDKRLYRATYATFEDYCRDRLGISKTHANRLVQSAEVLSNLTPIGVKPDLESQARPLSQLPAPQQRQAWQEAVANAPNGKPTAKVVQDVVNKMLGRPAVAPLRNGAPLPNQASLLEEEEDEVWEDAEDAPPPPVFTKPTKGRREKALEYWVGFLGKLNLWLSSLHEYGGYAGFTEGWDRYQKQSLRTHIRSLIRSLEEFEAQFTEEGIDAEEE